MRIDNFLAPASKTVRPSQSPEVDIHAPGTSKDCVVLSPSPHSNLSFDSDINKPGPSGISQFDVSSGASFLDDSKDRTLTGTPSEQSVCSSESNSYKSAMSLPPLPALDNICLLEYQGEEHSDLSSSHKADTQTHKSPRCSSEPCQVEKRSSSVQSHSSTTSAPCVKTRSNSRSKETKEHKEHESRPQKKGAFHKYTSASKEDKQIERERSDSMSSVDSISHELSHFRPIQSSPRTARRKLADGRSESPPIIQATPRNLKEMKTPVGGESPFVDPPPLVRAKFEKLVEERQMEVEATSKGTMTSKKVQHWKKIARPEARKSGIVSSSTKRKLSKFEFSSDSGFMQPPAKFSRMHVKGQSGDRRTVGTQKTIPVKKRQVIDFDTAETGTSIYQKSIATSCEAPASTSTVCESDQPKISDKNHQQVPKTTGAVSSGAKRKVLMDDFVKYRKDRDVPSPEAPCRRKNHENTSELAKEQTSQNSSNTISSVDRVDPIEESSSSSETSPSKVYKMRLKSKQGKVGGKESSNKSETPSKNSSDDVAKRKQTPVKCKSNESNPLPTTPTHNVADGSGDAKQSAVEVTDVNQSPENHRRGLRSQRLRNGTSPGKGILVETIQNGSKKDSDLVSTKQVCNLKSDNHRVRTACSPLNHTAEVITKSESPKVKRSPRSRKKKTVSSPKVSSPRACKNAVSPPPPLVKGTNSMRKSPKGRPGGAVKTPRTERRNTLWKYMELMTEEQKRLRQEEEDRRIALELQKEFDKQEKNRNKVVRAKGTKDAYRLRHGSSSSVP